MSSKGHIAWMTGVALTALATSAAPARADATSQFLQGLEGSWRGRGSAVIPGREAPERITCQVTNTYDESSQALVVNGECASTQGKTPVSGKLTHKDTAVSGSLIHALRGATLTKSNGAVNGTSLVVSSSFVDGATGNLTRTQQVISRAESGFSADFFTFDNASGAYKPAGTILFEAN